MVNQKSNTKCKLDRIIQHQLFYILETKNYVYKWLYLHLYIVIKNVLINININIDEQLGNLIKIQFLKFIILPVLKMGKEVITMLLRTRRCHGQCH